MKKLFILSLVCVTAFFNGCARQKPKFLTPTEAAEKFNRICKDEYALNIITRQLGNTLWIYIPFKGHLVDYKATPSFLAQMKKPENKPRLDYINGKFEDNNFNFEKTDSEIFWCVLFSFSLSLSRLSSPTLPELLLPIWQRFLHLNKS